jgi:hypothetical protein
MTQKLLTLPFRLGIGAARTALDLSSKTLDVSGQLAGTAIEILRPGGRSPEPSPPERATETPRTEAPAPRSRKAAPSRVNGHSTAPQTPKPAPAPPAEPAPPAPPAPVIPPEEQPATPLTHDQQVVRALEDEDELVAEFAEPGAEDGAGAQLEVDEPWEGYAQMNATALISRIGQADQAELAVVELYEHTHRKRQKVLSAATRRLRALSPPEARREAR